VTGFVLSGDGLPSVYVSGDNASLDVVRQAADHLAPIEIALVFAGAGRPPLFDAHLNLTSVQAARAGAILDARAGVVARTEGWAHLAQGPDPLSAAFAAEGGGDRLSSSPPVSAPRCGRRWPDRAGRSGQLSGCCRSGLEWRCLAARWVSTPTNCPGGPGVGCARSCVGSAFAAPGLAAAAGSVTAELATSPPLVPAAPLLSRPDRQLHRELQDHLIARYPTSAAPLIRPP
jgi:hypothetical protein